MSSKQPYFVHIGQGPCLLAALHKTIILADNSSMTSFTILTTASCDAFRTVHDRQPVFLSPDQATQWLQTAADSEECTQLLLTELEAVQRGASGVLQRHGAWHAVTPKMGNVSYQGRDCIMPWQPLLSFGKSAGAGAGAGTGAGVSSSDTSVHTTRTIPVEAKAESGAEPGVVATVMPSPDPAASPARRPASGTPQLQEKPSTQTSPPKHSAANSSGIGSYFMPSSRSRATSAAGAGASPSQPGGTRPVALVSMATRQVYSHLRPNIAAYFPNTPASAVSLANSAARISACTGAGSAGGSLKRHSGASDGAAADSSMSKKQKHTQTQAQAQAHAQAHAQAQAQTQRQVQVIDLTM